jgi:hypothetical protein
MECPVPGCGASLEQRSLEQHATKEHVSRSESKAKLVLMAAEERVELQGGFEGRKREAETRILELEKELEIERLASRGDGAWVFNWRAQGWDKGTYCSERHDFAVGLHGQFISHFMGCKLEDRSKYKVRAKYYILDKHDSILRLVFEQGSEANPNVAKHSPGLAAEQNILGSLPHADGGGEEAVGARKRECAAVGGDAIVRMRMGAWGIGKGKGTLVVVASTSHLTNLHYSTNLYYVHMNVRRSLVSRALATHSVPRSDRSRDETLRSE